MSIAIFNFGQGGGNAELNIAAYPSVGSLPASAEEGALAVITSTAIGDVYASVSAPSSPASGDVWVWLGNASLAPIVLNDRITLHPRACYQYDGSAWVIKDSYARKNSVWKQLMLYVYYYGSFPFTNSFSRASYSGGNCYVTLLSGSIQVHVNNTVNNAGKIDGYTTQAVDLTNISSIKIKYSSPTDARVATNMKLQVSLNGSVASASQSLSASSNGTGILNTSSLSGLYYIGYHAETQNLSYGMNGDHYIYEFELVR